MRRNKKAMLISAGILIIIAAALLFWVNGGLDKDRAGEIQTSAEEMEKEKKEEEQKEEKKEANKEQKKEAEKKDEEKNKAEPKAGAEEGKKEEVQKEAKEMQKDVSLVFSGDILLSNYVLNNYENSGINGVLSEGLQNEMKNADVTMVNQEFPFSNRGTQAPDKQFTFRVDPSYVKILQEMGIDAVTLANNHALDYGTEALADTFQTLDNAGIAYAGAGDSRERAMQPYVKEMGGKRFGFLAASRVIPEVSWNIENKQPGLLCTYDNTLLCQAIREVKKNCDYVVVYVHWGLERENTPQEYQRQLGQSYIDAGADLVIGSHPHVLQGIEYYQGKPIVYSLGNYIFNQEIGSTVLLKAVVTPENITKLQLIPAYASGAKTQEMDLGKSAELYRFMEEISFGISVGEDGTVMENQKQ